MRGQHGYVVDKVEDLTTGELVGQFLAQAYGDDPEQGFEIEPLEIIKDKRPPFIIREEFPAFGDFATAYTARFPRTKPLLGPEVRQLRLRLSSSRGGIGLIWRAP